METEDSVTHVVLRDCQKTRRDMKPEEFLSEKEAGLEMKKIMKKKQREVQEDEEQKKSRTRFTYDKHTGINDTTGKKVQGEKGTDVEDQRN